MILLELDLNWHPKCIAKKSTKKRVNVNPERLMKTSVFCSIFSVLLASGVASASIHGAIFTTLVDGTRVNANLYELKEDVYLDGGPGVNAPASAAGLPDGDYYFQVTDPSGKVLLSSDPVKCRSFRVEGGLIVEAYTAIVVKKIKGQLESVECRHNTGIDVDQNALTIQLMPYENTPNRGGVYKVWVTPVDEFVGDPNQVDNPDFFHGFVPRFSKTDNYKVQQKGRNPDPSILLIDVFGDCNLDGIQNGDDKRINSWPVTVTDPCGVSNTYFTPVDLYTADPGQYTIELGETPNTFVTTSILNGVTQSLYPHASRIQQVDVSSDTYSTNLVEFGASAYFDAKISVYYDANANGQRDPNEPGVAGSDVELEGTDIAGYLLGPLASITDAFGETVFTDLPSGDYCVKVIENSQIQIGDYGCFTTSPSTCLNVKYCLDSPYPVRLVEFFEVGYTCFRVADFSTKGYWHNKNGLVEMSQNDIDFANTLLMFSSMSNYFIDGDEPFDGFFADGTPVEPAFNNDGFEVALEGTPKAEVSHFLVGSNANGDPREQLAQQFLAIVFNLRCRIGSLEGAVQLPNGDMVSTGELIEQAELVWAFGTDEERRSLALTFDQMNNNDTVEATVPAPNSSL